MQRKVLIIASLLIILGFFVFNFDEAKSNHPLYNTLGWLWGGNTEGAPSVDTGIGLGWISTDSSNLKLVKFKDGYGINVPESNGPVTGYAWSSNLGWIKLQPIGGFPTTGCGGPCPTWASRREGNKLTGWARIVSIAKAIEDNKTAKNPNGNSGGWEGWIKLSGPGYATTIDSAGNITGSGWSNELGLIKFNAKIKGPSKGSPSCTLIANPSSGKAPLSGKLTWTTTNDPTSCVASGGWAGSKNIAGGSESYGPISATTRYNLNCVNAKGSGLCFAKAAIIPPKPLLSCFSSPNPTYLNEGGKTTWTAQGGNVPYKWKFDGKLASLTSASVLKTYSTIGTKKATVESKGFSPVSCTLEVKKKRPPGGKLTCSGSPDPAYLNTGGIITWTAKGGKAPYNWNFLDKDASPKFKRGQETSVAVKYSELGFKKARVNGVACKKEIEVKKSKFREINPSF